MPLRPVPSLIGVCVRSGTMDKAVKVRTTKQKLDSYLAKTFKVYPSYLLHDPNNSVRTGDIVRFQQFPVPTPSKRIRHMVTEIKKQALKYKM
ncbi:MAG: hypothetical protein LQ340_000945 [Diploschistes diacapsis]|nr:MAG: hypothetical protein LQ340_000945 [Diploschistes diacapsis]